MDLILKWWPVILVLGQAGALWVAWSIRQYAKAEIQAATTELKAADRELTDKLGDHADRLVKAEGRINVLEDDVADLPTKADIERLGQQVSGVDGQVKAVAGGVARLEGYFLQKGVEADRR